MRLRARVPRWIARAFAILLSIPQHGSRQAIGRAAPTMSRACCGNARSRQWQRSSYVQWKKVLKRGKCLDTLDPQHQHRLRIQAKKLRYAAEFFAPAFPRKKSILRRKDFVTSLQQLQDALGELNDIAVNEKLLKQLGDCEDAGAKRHGGRSRKAFLGHLSGREKALISPVLKEAERAYAAFAKAKPFWV